MNGIENTFVEKLFECHQHRERLVKAKEHLRLVMPLRLETYKGLDDVARGFIDQMIFRFSKLQDTMGEKLFPAFLKLLGEEVKSKSFIDRLNRLEELGLLSKEEWMGLRQDRNEIAHEYSFNQQDVVESINLLYERSERLLSIFEQFYAHCVQRFEFVRESPVFNRFTSL